LVEVTAWLAKSPLPSAPLLRPAVRGHHSEEHEVPRSSFKPEDETHVSIDNPSAVAYWTRALQCTPDQLRRAIAEVGASVDAVRNHLRAMDRSAITSR
jgi:hypothetical protein